MADLLFITPQEMTDTTIIGGNVDIDKYTMCILSTQLRVIEPLLGTLLYDKIIADIEASTLAGLYLTLFNDFVKPITKNEACAAYIMISPYVLSNSGLFKNNPDNAEVVDVKEKENLSEQYSSNAQMYVNRFNKWISKNELVEYKLTQDEVDAQNIHINNTWTFYD